MGLLYIYFSLEPNLGTPQLYGNLLRLLTPKKLGSIQRKFVALCQYCFCTYDHVTYKDFLTFLKRRTLHSRRIYLDALFFKSLFIQT